MIESEAPPCRIVGDHLPSNLRKEMGRYKAVGHSVYDQEFPDERAVFGTVATADRKTAQNVAKSLNDASVGRGAYIWTDKNYKARDWPVWESPFFTRKSEDSDFHERVSYWRNYYGE
jgi:hypothetical protein